MSSRRAAAAKASKAVASDENEDESEEEDRKPPAKMTKRKQPQNTNNKKKQRSSSKGKGAPKVNSSSDDDDEEEDNSKPQRVMVEFKFSSWPTHLFKEAGELAGTMSIPMDQDPKTGFYTIPVGKTICEVKVDTEKSSSLSWDERNKEFTMTFMRTKTNRLTLDPNLCLDYIDYDGEKEFQTDVRPADAESLFDGHDAVTRKSKKFSREDGNNLKKWENDQGGILNFYASVSGKYPKHKYDRYDAKYKIKLYTVLSADPANVEQPTIQKGDKPDWERLVKVVAARNPDKGKLWPKKAVDQYKHFLELKLKKGFEQISPSESVDNIWHTHLSFVEQYQRDTLCLTNGKHIIQHLPVYIEDSYKNYAKAYKEHSKRMNKKGLKVNNEFWPELPTSPPKSKVHDGDSSDHITDAAESEESEDSVDYHPPIPFHHIARCAPCG